jgi:hypothetical protein
MLIAYGHGPIFTKFRRRKHKRRDFFCFRNGEVTLQQSPLLDNTWKVKVKLIYEVYVLLVSVTLQVNVSNVWTYVYVHVYEL